MLTLARFSCVLCFCATLYATSGHLAKRIFKSCSMQPSTPKSTPDLVLILCARPGIDQQDCLGVHALFRGR
eukprot:1287105-Amphidinium_carterae.1